MTSPDERIINFIKKHHVLTLATSRGNQSWCCNCFYAFDSNAMEMYFLTDDTTRHGAEILDNEIVSGSIVLESKLVGKLQGIQFSGIAFKASDGMLNNAKNRYLKRFPYAIAATSPVWALRIDFLKFTDNTLGFGKKLLWERNSM